MVAHHGREKKKDRKSSNCIIYKGKQFCIFSKMKPTKKNPTQEQALPKEWNKTLKGKLYFFSK